MAKVVSHKGGRENIVLWSSSTKAAKELVKNYQVMKILSRKSVMLDAL